MEWKLCNATSTAAWTDRTWPNMCSSLSGASLSTSSLFGCRTLSHPIPLKMATPLDCRLQLPVNHMPEDRTSCSLDVLSVLCTSFGVQCNNQVFLLLLTRIALPWLIIMGILLFLWWVVAHLQAEHGKLPMVLWSVYFSTLLTLQVYNSCCVRSCSIAEQMTIFWASWLLLVADNVDGFYVCCGISLAELCKCPYILRLTLFLDGHVSPRRWFCISFDFVFAAVLIFHVVKMVMVVGVARSIHLTLILLRLLGSTCAMASSSFFTRFFSHYFHLSIYSLSLSLSRP